MTKYIIPIPIYNGTLHLVDCKDTKEALMEIKGDDYSEDDDAEACLFWNHESKSANWWLCIDLQDTKLGILVHELFHATHRILEYFGVEFTSTNHEPFAYLIEYLYNECVKIKKGIGFTGESSYIKV